MVVKSIIEWHSSAVQDLRHGDRRRPVRPEVFRSRHSRNGSISKGIFFQNDLCSKTVTHEPIVTPEHVLSILGDVVELDIPDG